MSDGATITTYACSDANRLASALAVSGSTSSLTAYTHDDTGVVARNCRCQPFALSDPANARQPASALYTLCQESGVDPVAMIKDVITRPYATSPAINKATKGGATAYFRKDGAHVVRDNATLEIIQVSDINDPDWIPDATIQNPYKPK